MKVKVLIEELSKVNPNFDVMISVGRKGERDLIEKVRNVECPNPSRFPDFGWVELDSCNPIDWHYLSREDLENHNKKDGKYSMENIELVHGGSGITADPRQVPLTDEEIDKAFEERFTAKKVNIGISEKDMEKNKEMVSANTGVPKRLLEEKDNINPDHYKSSTSLECIEAMKMVFGREAVIDFCVCNTWKYIWRWKHKNGQEDLKKADWYIVKAKELIDNDPLYHTSAVNLGVINRMRNYISKHKEETND